MDYPVRHAAEVVRVEPEGPPSGDGGAGQRRPSGAFSISMIEFAQVRHRVSKSQNHARELIF